MNKLTVQDVQKSFTDYVALVKKTCKTEKEIQDLKRENDNKIQKIMVNNQALIAENEKLNQQLDAIEKTRFSEKTTKTKPNTKKEVEMTTSKPQWNASTHIKTQGPSATQGTKIKRGGTRRRKNIKKCRTHKHQR